MRLVLHLLQADTRRFAWPIAIWIALTATAAAFQGAVPRLSGVNDMWPALMLSMMMLSAARIILAAALIVLVVQAHSPVGTEAFWLTRPLPRSTLVLSKLLVVLGLVVAVPAVCDAMVMLAYEAPPADVAKVVAEGAIVGAVVALIVMVLAAWTRNVAQFTLTCGAVLAAAAIVATLYVAVMSWKTQRMVATVALVSADLAQEIHTRWPDGSGTVVSWAVLIATALLAVWWQYRYRVRSRSVSVSVVGVVAAALVGANWPWAFLHAEPATPAWAVADDLRLEAPAQAIWFDNGGFQRGEAPRWHMAHAEMHLRGIANHWFAHVQLLKGTLRYEGRTVSSGPAPGSVVVSDAPGAPNARRAAVMKVLDVPLIRDQWHARSSRVPVMFVSHDDLPLSRTRAAYDGEFQIQLRHVELAATLPLQRGEVFRDGAYRIEIERVESREGGPRIHATLSTAFSVFDRFVRPAYSVYLRNTRTGEALEGQMRATTSHLRRGGPLVLGPYAPFGRGTGFFADAYEIRFASTYGAQLPSALSRGGASAWKDHEWLDSAEVVIVRTTVGPTVTRTLTIPHVALNGGANVTTER